MANEDMKNLTDKCDEELLEKCWQLLHPCDSQKSEKCYMGKYAMDLNLSLFDPNLQFGNLNKLKTILNEKGINIKVV
jgi:hypothetical protein